MSYKNVLSEWLKRKDEKTATIYPVTKEDSDTFGLLLELETNANDFSLSYPSINLTLDGNSIEEQYINAFIMIGLQNDIVKDGKIIRPGLKLSPYEISEFHFLLKEMNAYLTLRFKDLNVYGIINIIACDINENCVAPILQTKSRGYYEKDNSTSPETDIIALKSLIFDTFMGHAFKNKNDKGLSFEDDTISFNSTRKPKQPGKE